jgi:Response regulators consisting of a CheY-like receiver domain and a winged-helix DNA-binding domain
VLDLNLPGMDGLEVCRKLRSEARKQTPVLMLTARIRWKTSWPALIPVPMTT